MMAVRQQLRRNNRGPARIGVAIAAISLAAWPGLTASAATVISPNPPVKYYVVHDPHYIQMDFLRGLASKTLGNANLYMEIFNLNKGRLQPDGKRLEPGSNIDPGWILELPPAAHGPLVYDGPLPLNAAAQPASPQPAASSPRPSHPAASARPAAKSGSAGFAVIMVAALAGPSIVAGVVTFLLTRRSRRPGGRHHEGRDVDIWSAPPENAHQASSRSPVRG